MFNYFFCDDSSCSSYFYNCPETYNNHTFMNQDGCNCLYINDNEMIYNKNNFSYEVDNNIINGQEIIPVDYNGNCISQLTINNNNQTQNYINNNNNNNNQTQCQYSQISDVVNITNFPYSDVFPTIPLVVSIPISLSLLLIGYFLVCYIYINNFDFFNMFVINSNEEENINKYYKELIMQFIYFFNIPEVFLEMLDNDEIQFKFPENVENYSQLKNFIECFLKPDSYVYKFLNRCYKNIDEEFNEFKKNYDEIFLFNKDAKLCTIKENEYNRKKDYDSIKRINLFTNRIQLTSWPYDFLLKYLQKEINEEGNPIKIPNEEENKKIITDNSRINVNHDKFSLIFKILVEKVFHPYFESKNYIDNCHNPNTIKLKYLYEILNQCHIKIFIICTILFFSTIIIISINIDNETNSLLFLFYIIEILPISIICLCVINYCILYNAKSKKENICQSFYEFLIEKEYIEKKSNNQVGAIELITFEPTEENISEQTLRAEN
jgi:hypothetical protein